METSKRIESDKRKQVKHPWSKQEQDLFIKALDEYGPKDLKAISDMIGTRTKTQVRSHLQKHLMKVK